MFDVQKIEKIEKYLNQKEMLQILKGRPLSVSVELFNTDLLNYLMGKKKRQTIDLQFKHLPFSKGNTKWNYFCYQDWIKHIIKFLWKSE